MCVKVTQSIFSPNETIFGNKSEYEVVMKTTETLKRTPTFQQNKRKKLNS